MTQEVPELVPTEVPEPAPPELPEPVQKCANCGADLRPTDRYCGGCGLPAFVPAKAEVTTPAPEPKPETPAPAAATVPPVATAAPPPAQKSDNRVWAIVAGVILLLVGVASCGIGVIAMATASWFATDAGIDPSMWTAGSGLCCVLPSVLLMIAGAVVWYAWGRKKA
jgi:pyruvate/2-oxoglutarate dehydrogenase complex dihydrolipoamide acyltransferase (E2) component